MRYAANTHRYETNSINLSTRSDQGQPPQPSRRAKPRAIRGGSQASSTRSPLNPGNSSLTRIPVKSLSYHRAADCRTPSAMRLPHPPIQEPLESAAPVVCHRGDLGEESLRICLVCPAYTEYRAPQFAPPLSWAPLPLRRLIPDAAQFVPPKLFAWTLCINCDATHLQGTHRWLR